MSKNITYSKGGTAKIGDPVIITNKTREGQTKREGIVVAVNAETDKDNLRIVFTDSLHILPKFSASEVELFGSAPGAVAEEGSLRTDGPTLTEYVAAGLPAENYPPKGYTDKRTDEEIAEALRAKAEKESAIAGTGKTDIAGSSPTV